MQVCNGCSHLNLDEQEQNRLKQQGIFKNHYCNKYQKQVFHYSSGRNHDPNIYSCSECISDNEAGVSGNGAQNVSQDGVQQMPIYIDADKLKDDFGNPFTLNMLWTLTGVLEVIERQPNADVQKVRHAKWSDKMVCYKDDFGNYHSGYECLACHEISNKTIFCGWCGAIMDGKTDEKQG